MSTVSLDEFIALNDQLVALRRTSVPFDVGLEPAGSGESAALERINAVVARRVRLGATLADALEAEEATLPSAYRCLIQVWLKSGNLATALNGSSRLARTADGSWHAVRMGLLYPLAVCCVAYAGLIVLCLFFAPTLENLYLSMRLRPGSGVLALAWLRGTLPYWVAVPPAALVLFAAWQWQARRGRTNSDSRSVNALGSLPGVSQTIHLERSAIFADTLAALLAGGAPLAESLLLAGTAAEDVELHAGSKELAVLLAHGQMPPDDSSAARRFPPFLRWAVWHSEATTGRVRALEMAAGLYRAAAARRAAQLRTTAPLVASIVIGGSVTMLYALALFLPIVQMLTQLSGTD